MSTATAALPFSKALDSISAWLSSISATCFRKMGAPFLLATTKSPKAERWITRDLISTTKLRGGLIKRTAGNFDIFSF